jgi:hypothetical protein
MPTGLEETSVLEESAAIEELAALEVDVVVLVPVGAVGEVVARGVVDPVFSSFSGEVVGSGELSLALGSTLVMADATDPLLSLTLVGLDCVSSTTAAVGSGILSKKAQALLETLRSRIQVCETGKTRLHRTGRLHRTFCTPLCIA